MALEASTVPPEGAPETELEQHRIAKMVDGLIDRKVSQYSRKALPRFYLHQALFVVMPRVCLRFKLLKMVMVEPAVKQTAMPIC